MNNTRLVIAGAVFYDLLEDRIAIPNITGEFVITECNTFYKKEDYIKFYGKTRFKKNKDNFIEKEGEKYYSSEDIEIIPNINLKLLSDLTTLCYSA
ncbi:hypothetical protein [Riemerella anatipestifer]|uniref:hypothetical protein n=1 Tax=Riemerella anatipestifer TaxID=34085 RepID=UPI00129E53F0|nr:hypothetical protein [Riemerella anatipestifer]MRM84287.1 hypothetical protein [Riemerella anatipestifer]